MEYFVLFEISFMYICISDLVLLAYFEVQFVTASPVEFESCLII